MNKQEIINRVWTHFVVEKQPAGWDIDQRGCRYRTSDGHCCAVGLFIPDEKYNRNFEGMTVGEVCQFALPGLPDESYVLLVHIQRIHDVYATEDAEKFIKSISTRLRILASSYGLTVPGDALNA